MVFATELASNFWERSLGEMLGQVHCYLSWIDDGPRVIFRLDLYQTQAELLSYRGIDAVTVVGLATDFCVAHTAEGALRAGLEVTIERAAIRGIDQGGSERALAALATHGAEIH